MAPNRPKGGLTGERVPEAGHATTRTGDPGACPKMVETCPWIDDPGSSAITNASAVSRSSTPTIGTSFNV